MATAVVPPKEPDLTESHSVVNQDADSHRLIHELEQHDLEIYRQIIPSVPNDPPPEYSEMTPMLPCVIPQASTSLKGAFMCPFIRAYPPQLHARGIDEARFLEFLDGFNEAFVTSPAFEAGNFAGLIMSHFHGLEPVQWAGYGLMAASTLGGAAVSFIRAKAYVKAHNEKLFEPSGMRCSVLTTEKLIANIGYPHEKLQLLPMYQEDAKETGDSLQPTVAGHQVLERRLQALEGYVQPLNLDVPPSQSFDNYFKRLGEWQANRRLQKQEAKLEKRRSRGERKQTKRELKGERRQMKLDHKLGLLEQKLEGLKISRDRQLASPSAQTNPKIRDKIEAEFAKDSAKLEKKLARKSAKGERKAGKREDKTQRKQDKVDRREHRMANKVRWIIISEWDPRSSKEEDVDDDSSDLVSDASSIVSTESSSSSSSL